MGNCRHSIHSLRRLWDKLEMDHIDVTMLLLAISFIEVVENLITIIKQLAKYGTFLSQRSYGYQPPISQTSLLNKLITSPGSMMM